jgi:hypothetical protein
MLGCRQVPQEYFPDSPNMEPIKSKVASVWPKSQHNFKKGFNRCCDVLEQEVRGESNRKKIPIIGFYSPSPNVIFYNLKKFAQITNWCNSVINRAFLVTGWESISGELLAELMTAFRQLVPEIIDRSWTIRILRGTSLILLMTVINNMKAPPREEQEFLPVETMTIGVDSSPSLHANWSDVFDWDNTGNSVRDEGNEFSWE